MNTKIIIYDDNKERRESLKVLVNLQKDMTCTGIFKLCTQALNDIADTKPDVILMDINMPEMSGIEAVKKIRSKFPDIKIIMQTVFDDPEKIFAAIEAGADGYFLKSSSASKLIEGIKEVMDGGAPMTASVARIVLNKFKEGRHVSSHEDLQLNEQERSILANLVNGLSYKMIADKLDISIDTVRDHIKRIYRALEVNSKAEVIRKSLEGEI